MDVEGQLEIAVGVLVVARHGAQDGQIQRVFLKTDVEIREGQKAVVGKSTPRGTDETLILIVEARVLD